MDLNEFNRLNKQFENFKKINDIVRIVQEFKRMKAALDAVKSVQLHQQIIREFVDNHPEWRKYNDSKLEVVREQSEYNEEGWREIVRQLRSN